MATVAPIPLLDVGGHELGNKHLAPVAQVRKLHPLTKELDHDDGEVTATMKVRRSSIHKAYAAEIEAPYG